MEKNHCKPQFLLVLMICSNNNNQIFEYIISITTVGYKILVKKSNLEKQQSVFVSLYF